MKYRVLRGTSTPLPSRLGGVPVLTLSIAFAFAATAAQPPLKISFGSAAPMVYTDSAGNPAGFMVDAMNEAARRAGYTLEWRAVGDAQANNDALRNGGLDIISGMDTPERRRMFFVSEPWWSSELIALMPATSPIRQEGDLNGRRLAVPSSIAAVIAQHYSKSTVIPVRSAVEAAEAACGGTAGAAIFAGMYSRELLFAASPACQGVSLRTVDVNPRIDYVLIVRPETVKAVRALKSRLDEITADGTLASVAARHPPVSTPYAIRLAELVRLRFERQIWGIGMAASAILILLGAAFTVKQYRSRRRLRALNAQLQEDLSALSRAETALRNSEARFRVLFDSAPQTVLAMNRSGTIVFANKRLEEVFGHARERLIGQNAAILLPDHPHEAPPGRHGPAATSGVGRRKDGSEFPIEISLCSVETDDGLTLAFITDISERVALQQQLLQSQKLESIGHLAGGVAHDFNNLLTVMSGYAEMVLDDLPPNDRLREPMVEIGRAAERATSLTRQLLLFSRREMVAPKILSLNELVGNLEKMLRRVIGEDVELILALDPRIRLICADPGHIEQVVMNLVVNARDAMPEGGRLVIETADFPVDESRAADYLDLAPGDHVVLTVRDSGTGMSPEVRARIFEPFFTTKEQGKGTGLGLSTVYGIVKQSGGAVFVYSEPGKGTAFKVVFPMADGPQQPDAGPRETPAGLSGKETILVAEDEPGIRKFMSEVLRSNGYTVLEAEGGREALELAGKHTGPIHLLVTDVVMPEMSGLDLAQRFVELHPGVPVLRMSGYSDRLWRQEVPGAFIEKPFTPTTLLQRIREILDVSGAQTPRPRFEP